RTSVSPSATVSVAAVTTSHSRSTDGPSGAINRGPYPTIGTSAGTNRTGDMGRCSIQLASGDASGAGDAGASAAAHARHQNGTIQPISPNAPVAYVPLAMALAFVVSSTLPTPAPMA